MIGIKDFTMPKNCGECRCYDVEKAGCSFLDKDTEGFDKRPTDCPLVDDVAPVKHGKWKNDGEMIICSNCGGSSDAYMDCYDVPFKYKGRTGWARRYPKYCKRCGAKMDNDLTDEELEELMDDLFKEENDGTTHNG